MVRSDVVCDVLVVGAGPGGLTAVALLAARGLDVVVVERNSTTSSEPKAISLDDESLRTYQSAGIADLVLDVVVPGTGTAYYGADGDLLFQGRAPVPHRHGHPFKNPFAQPDLERVLLDHLAAHPRVRLAFGTEVVDLEQDGEEVRATTVLRTTLHASYVLGADGGRSTVRSLCGIAMSGHRHDEAWLVVDTTGDSRTERYGMHHGDPVRPHVIVPGLHGRCRYEFVLDPDEHPGDGPPPFALVKALLAPYRDVRPEQVERAVAYTFNSLAVVRTGSPGTLDHYSYDLSVWEDFKTWCDRLTELGVRVAWGPGRHGPGDNLFVFFDDPAGNHVELSVEMEKFHDDRAVYAPRRWTAVPASVNLWGGQLPTWRHTGETGATGTGGGTA